MGSNNCKPMDRFGFYLKDIGRGKALDKLCNKSGVSKTKLTAMRRNISEPIKYMDALRLCKASDADHKLNMSDFDARTIPDREKYETPLGLKIAKSIIKSGDSLHARLAEHSIAHNEINRILLNNTTWSAAVRKKLSDAFDRGDIKITEEDYEDQVVNRLKSKWEAARDELERRRPKKAGKKK